MAHPQIANFSGHAIQTRGHSLLRRFSRHCPYHRDRLPGPKRADPQGCLPQEPRKNRGATEDYLRDTRDAPLSPHEIKAGREIPAVLEQSLNSDLPGEFKALVTYHVYDTPTDEYLLIPQGARLAGKYDSRVSCSQDGVLVAWSLVLSPDASSIDLDGMLGSTPTTTLACRGSSTATNQTMIRHSGTAPSASRLRVPDRRQG